MVGQFEMVFESNCQEHAYTSTTIIETIVSNGPQLATLSSNEVSLKLASLHAHNRGQLCLSAILFQSVYIS